MNIVAREFEPFQAAWDSRFGSLKRWKDEGRTIFGYPYCDVPVEIVHAAGIFPLQLTGSGMEKHHQLGTSISANCFCEYSMSIVGQSLDGYLDLLDGAVFAHSCETMRMVASAWELTMPDKFFYFFPTVQKNNAANQNFVKAEMQALREAIEGYIGCKITDEGLRNSINIYNRQRALVRRLYELRQRENPFLSESMLNLALRTGSVMPIELHIEMLDDLLGTLGEASGTLAGRPRVSLMLSGFSPEHYFCARLNIGELIESQLGARIAIDDFAEGHRYWWAPTPQCEDPVDALVERFLGRPPVSFRRTATQEASRILDLAGSHKVQGIVMLVPKYCSDFLYQVPFLESEIRKAGPQVLTIETGDNMPLGQLTTRLGAFIEVLEGG